MAINFPSARVAITILTMVLITSSCEKQMLVLVRCNDCIKTEPTSAQLILKLYEDYVIFNSIDINVYEGDNTDGPVILRFTGQPGGTRRIDVAINRTYTIEAIYVKDGRIYKVYNSARPRVKYSESDCDDPCYFIYNNKIDLRLRYF